MWHIFKGVKDKPEFLVGLYNKVYSSGISDTKMEFLNMDCINADFISSESFTIPPANEIQVPGWTDSEINNLFSSIDNLNYFNFDFYPTYNTFLSNDVVPYDTIGDPSRTYNLPDLTKPTSIDTLLLPQQHHRANSVESSGSDSTETYTPRTLTPPLMASTPNRGLRAPLNQPGVRYRLAGAGAPYRLQDRPPRRSSQASPLSLEQQPTTLAATSGTSTPAFASVPIFDPMLIFTPLPGTAPGVAAPVNAVLSIDPRDRIRREHQSLKAKLRANQIFSEKHHEAFTCPVFDCEKGGWNVLLHGPNPNAGPGETKGKFFSANELNRHVRSKHLPDEDLRCDYPECATQRRLEKGYFSRVDVMKKHLDAHPEHKTAISEELRRKYKLFEL